MKNLACPDCGTPASAKSEKIRLSFIGESLDCQNCGARLSAGARFSSAVLGAIAGNALLYVLLFSETIGSWLLIALLLITTWAVVSGIAYFTGLRRHGSKKLQI